MAATAAAARPPGTRPAAPLCPDAEVVAAAAQGPSEVIRDGGTGLLVPLEEPAPLAAAIRRVLDDPALSGRLAEAGRRDFEAEHAAAPVLARWRGFLRAVAPTAAGGEVG